MLRLRAAPTQAEVDGLNEEFVGLLRSGRIETTAPLGAEVTDDDLLELPRLVLTPQRRAVGELHRLIRAVNELPSAPAGGDAPANN